MLTVNIANFSQCSSSVPVIISCYQTAFELLLILCFFSKSITSDVVLLTNCYACSGGGGEGGSYSIAKERGKRFRGAYELGENVCMYVYYYDLQCRCLYK